MKTRLTHVRANVKNLYESIKWYEDVLGFKVTGVWPEVNPNYAHFESEEGAVFSIMEDINVPSHGRFNFLVSDIESLWNDLKDKVAIVEELINTPYGSIKFTIKDLDGNELGFVKA